MGENDNDIISYLEFLAEKDSRYRDMIEFNEKHPVKFRMFLDDFITYDLPRLAKNQPELAELYEKLMKE